MLNHKHAFIAVFITLFMLLAVAPVMAQDVPTTPPEQGELAAALLALVKLVSDLTFVPIAAPFVIAATALLKKLIPSSLFSAGTIALTVQVIVWVVYIVAKHFGYSDQFGTYINALTTILAAVGGLVASSAVSNWGYNKLKGASVPLLGTPQKK